MLFNSHEFIFVFLPATLALFIAFGRVSRQFALSWLIVASLLFYAWWRPVNLWVICVSLAGNYLVARLLLRLAADDAADLARKLLLIVGIACNLLFLGYFKYVTFAQTAINDIAGTDIVLTYVVLPLGISFFTFQQIAFLVDVHGRNVESFRARDFCLFVLFFPQLIAGPIVHYREMMPQFHANPCRFDREGLAVGLTLFLFGLFKKAVLADGVAAHVTPIYDLAADGGAVSLLPAWTAAVGFTLQIYFDFSGYSDMAAGLARCFGVRLPINFDSPLKATNIIDFWSRWHITLTRFLTAYVYNPLALWLTRRRLARGLPGFGRQRPNLGAFVQVLALPTILTMFLSGLWHGAGYLFILWGVLHGGYLAINHAWRLVGPSLWHSRASYERVMRPVGSVVTLLAVVVAMVLFRSESWAIADEILRGMAGGNGIALPQPILDQFGLGQALGPLLTGTDARSATDFLAGNVWIAALLLIALVPPNTLELMARYEPVLGIKPPAEDQPTLARRLSWSPTMPWAAFMCAVAAAAILKISGDSEFLYWQF